MLALTSVTGKLGSSTINSLFSHSLIAPDSLVFCTSTAPTSPKLAQYSSLSIPIRAFDYLSPDPNIFSGCTKLYLVSTPVVEMDYNNAPAGQGREKAHILTINAAIAAGVKHIYYTSLAFGSNSDAGVMRAHLRTEQYLKDLTKETHGEVTYTIIREGLYNESWPLYLGYYDATNDDERSEIVLAGDGEISWTSIADLGLGTALIVSDPDIDRWAGKTLYLSNTKHQPRSLRDLANLLSEVKGKEINVKIVGREEYVDYYVARGRDRESVEWWSTTYAALKKGECEIEDGTLTELLASRGKSLTGVEETLRGMLKD